MEYIFLLKGLFIGFSVAAPIGVVGLLCINRTLLQGSSIGFVSGLGAATAHGIYGFIAGFGLTFISDFLIEGQFHLRLFSGIYFYYLGVKTFISRPTYKKQTFRVSSISLINSYLSSLVVAITNPLTILSFAGVFAGLGLANKTTNYDSGVILVLGIFLGSACWWFMLSSSVGLLRHKLDSQTLQLLNRISGIMILFFGFVVLCQLLINW